MCTNFVGTKCGKWRNGTIPWNFPVWPEEGLWYLVHHLQHYWSLGILKDWSQWEMGAQTLTVRLELTISALNGLQVKAACIVNAYVTASITENIWTILGPDIGADTRKKSIIVCALYVLKSSGAAFRNNFSDCMHYMRYKYCIADPYLWLKPEVRTSDGFEYYYYILFYVEKFCASIIVSWLS